MNRLKDLRRSANYTLRELSDLTGIANSTISEIENGKRTMTFNHAKKLSKVLKHDPVFIMGTDAIKFDKTKDAGLREVIKTAFYELFLHNSDIDSKDTEGKQLLIGFLALSDNLKDEDIDDILHYVSDTLETRERMMNRNSTNDEVK